MPTITINQKSETRNSKQIRNSKLETVSNFSFRASNLFRFSNFVFRICLVFLISHFVFTLPVLAGTDPKTSSPYATASIPALAVAGDSQAPSIPILIRPEGSSVTSDNTPEYVWNGSTDVGSNTVLYTLYLNSVATYLGISNLGNSAGVGYTARLEAGDLYLTASSALPDGLYHWHVTASDLSGNTSRSTIWGFTIDTLPPALSVVELDTLSKPVITEGANFDIAGPKDLYLTVVSDPSVTVQLTLSPSSEPCASECSELLVLTALTSPSGLATFHLNLALGVHSLNLLAIDGALNTTTLPEFTLTITQAQITVPLPPLPGLPPSLSIPYTPYSPPSLPATIAQLTRPSYHLSSLIYLLLALGIIGLLLYLRKHRYNLILIINPAGAATIYHSVPNLTPNIYHLIPADRGRLRIPHLSRYSTLTIRVNPAGAADQRLDSRTYILSISRPLRLYTIVLG